MPTTTTPTGGGLPSPTALPLTATGETTTRNEEGRTTVGTALPSPPVGATQTPPVGAILTSATPSPPIGETQTPMQGSLIAGGYRSTFTTEKTEGQQPTRSKLDSSN